MARFPETVTLETFSDASAAALRAEALVRQKQLIRKIARPLSRLLFVSLSFLLSFGAFLEISSPKEAMQ